MNFLHNIGKQTNAETNIENNGKQPYYTPFQIEQIRDFKLPISYLDNSTIFTVSDIVSNDLELTKNNSSDEKPCIYDYLLKPSNAFSKLLIPSWQNYYTTDTLFLNDTQHIIKNIHTVREQCKNEVECQRIFEIWDTVKQDPNFLERYSYIDWEMIKQFNHSSSFLQLMSVINISSPLLSLIIPFIFLLFPFVLLKIQKIPISFTSYVDILKNLAKHHFIGKTISTIQTFSWDKIVYVLITFGLYLLQIYQNINSCIRYYNNIKKINQLIIDLREYANDSINKINCFLDICENCESYKPFCIEAIEHRNNLILLLNELNEIKPFENSVKNFTNTGVLMKCFYHIYENPLYENSVKFSMGFNGYIDNLLGIYDNFNVGNISLSTFDTSKECEFREQYYPPLLDENPIKNTCKFDKNMIISAPNKGGKTTILKTCAINIIFSQQFGCGFYESANIIPYTHIHSYLNIPDTSERDSLFQAESRRCKDIIDTIIENNDNNNRHFCIFDELYSGTNPTEAAKAGKAFLNYLSNYPNVSFLLTTHYKDICKHFKRSKYIQNYKMDVKVLDDGNYKYNYKLKKGISHIKGAIRVLKDMNYPPEILANLE